MQNVSDTFSDMKLTLHGHWRSTVSIIFKKCMLSRLGNETNDIRSDVDHPALPIFIY